MSVEEIKNRKNACRELIKQRKQQFTVEELRQKSIVAVGNLLALPVMARAHTVMLYHSLPDEVDTHLLIHQLISSKRIVLPVVCGKEAFPVELRHEKDVSEGPFRIMEPQNPTVFSETIDVIVVPGVAFNRQGHRLGRGKGYYDGLLAHYPDVQKIGLCFDFQIVETIPTEQHDIIMDKIITD